MCVIIKFEFNWKLLNKIQLIKFEEYSVEWELAMWKISAKATAMKEAASKKLYAF